MSEKTPKSLAISVRFEMDQLEALDRLAEKERLDRSALVRRLVDEALAAREEGPVPAAADLRAELVKTVREYLASPEYREDFRKFVREELMRMEGRKP